MYIPFFGTLVFVSFILLLDFATLIFYCEVNLNRFSLALFLSSGLSYEKFDSGNPG